MGNVNGWSKLLGDSFFQHMEGCLDSDDAQRLLTIISEEFYLQGISFSINDKSQIIPEGNVHKEAIGFKAEMAKRGLKELLEATKGAAPDIGENANWMHQFLTDQSFQAYVFQLLDFVTACVQSSLPSRKQIPSLEDRVKAAAQDNAKELEDEVEKAEAARISAEKAGEAAKEAQEAVEKAKTTADSIMPNMLTTLGVFIAIVIAVVGCYLSVLLAHHAQDAKTLNMVMILLMGHILLNIIFLLLYLISKMSAHSLACHCLIGDKMDCQECDSMLREQCRLRHKLWLRYPYVVAMNGIFVVAYCMLGLWYLINHYFGDTVDQMLKDNLICATVVVGITIVLIIAIGVFVFRFFLHSPRHKAEKAQEKKQKAHKKEEKAQAKKQKAESEHKNVRALRGQLSKQEDRIASLEKEVEMLAKKLEQYRQEEESAPVK